MNDVKSMPFEHIVKAKNPCIPPKYSKSPRFGKLREIRQPFFNLTANCAKSAQFTNPHSESREISAIHANFYDSLLFR